MLFRSSAAVEGLQGTERRYLYKYIDLNLPNGPGPELLTENTPTGTPLCVAATGSKGDQSPQLNTCSMTESQNWD